jgi:hypothetical protein
MLRALSAPRRLDDGANFWTDFTCETSAAPAPQVGAGADPVARACGCLHTLACFFATHKFRRAGYVEPFR